MAKWLGGNHFTLLENGEAFFPRVFECIACAQREIIIETFILFEDPVGLQLHTALTQAAQRGVQIDITVDGWGSPDLSDRFVRSLSAAGVRLHVFDPGPRPFGFRPNALRRMHRKIVVVDALTAFVGGINYSIDHLAEAGPRAKQDYAVEIRGPIVAVIHRFTLEALAEGLRQHLPRQPLRPICVTQIQPAGTGRALFVVRDNVRHRDAIEKQYRLAIRMAKRRILIANAYFFPGFRLVRELRRAAQRGVDVCLILQGQPDMVIAKKAATTLYHHLMQAGVRIFEYFERPLHGKVAVADDEWCTVGSSNLDPLSLALNLEANVIVRDPEFNAALTANLQTLMRVHCYEIDPASVHAVHGWALLRSYLAFHVMRQFARWAQWLPLHAPRLYPARGDLPLPAACIKKPP